MYSAAGNARDYVLWSSVDSKVTGSVASGKPVSKSGHSTLNKRALNLVVANDSYLKFVLLWLLK